MASQTLKGTNLAQQKVAAYVKLLQKDDHAWNALIVFLGALFLLGAIPFYPIYLVPVLAIISAAASYKVPWLGTLLSMVFAFPAAAYQNAAFGWLFLILIAIVLFEMMKNWLAISWVQVLIMAPFSFGGLPLFGWITVLGMTLGAMYFGSKKSISLSVSSVFLILFLSAIWVTQNSVYLPLNLPVYSPPEPALQFTRQAAGIESLASALGGALGSLFSFDNLRDINPALGRSFDIVLRILFSDTGIFQMLVWAIALYAVSYLSGTLKGNWSQTLASGALVIVLIGYFILGMLVPDGFKVEMLGAIGASIAVVGLFDYFSIKISREETMRRAARTAQFGKFGLQDLAEDAQEKSLKDVGGYEDVKQELRDAILMPLEKKELAYTYGIKAPSGILLFGPPGTGKTMMMRALSRELKYGFYYIKASDILSQWYGESERNVSEIFAIARKNAPSILFFDEIDSIGKKRGGYSTDEITPRILSILLQEMDGIKKESAKPVMVIGATNVPDTLDPALLRPGRFDKIIYMNLPDKEARMAIFENYLKRVPRADDINLDVLAAKTERFSGADLKNVAQEATKLAAKDASKLGKVVPISMAHLLTVLKTVKPSTSIASLESYQQFKLDFERRVGGAKAEEEKKGDSVHWEDVAGLDKVKQALLETIELPLLHEAEMKEFKVKPSKGILLFGPPGTGKTLIVKAASQELNASFQTLSPAELVKQGYTQAVTIIKEAFNRARENPPGIIFVDEVETFTPSRRIAGTSEILGQFLTEMDGLKELKGVVIIAATNKPSLLDPAILRPGRFDKIFYIPPPDTKGREDMFRIHLGKFADAVDVQKLATMTAGFSGADIANICQEAKMYALRQKLGGKQAGVSTDLIARVVRTRKPSITRDLLEEYQQFIEAYGERGHLPEE